MQRCEPTSEATDIFNALMTEQREIRRLENLLRESEAECAALRREVSDLQHRVLCLRHENRGLYAKQSLREGDHD